MEVQKPRRSRGTSKLPRRVSEMSKEALEATLKKKRECNAKAIHVVECLLENTISKDEFLDCLKYISESHFQDVIEERAISLNCGYPLCQKKLKNIPSQQYHVSTKMNKVYDITERKNFCSNHCYKASSYVKAQLLSSPLWLRDKEQIPKFHLLPAELTSGGIGEEVDIGQSSSLKEEFKQLHKHETSNKFMSVSEFTIDALSELVSDTEKKDKKGKSAKDDDSYKEERNENKSEVKDEFNAVKNDCVETNNAGTLQFQNATSDNVDTDRTHETKQDNTVGTKNVLEAGEVKKTESSDKARYRSYEIPNNFRDIPHDSSVIHNVSNPTEPVHSKTRELKPQKNKESKKTSLDIPPMTNAVIHIEKCLHEWFTFESMCFLFGEEKIKEIVEEKGECIKEYYKAVPKATWDPRIEEQYLAICRRLNIMEIEDKDYDYQQVTKPLPDYATLSEEAKKADLKVRAYYQGKTAYEDAGSINISETDNNFTPVLPLVDIHAQNALRRRIVLDNLNRVLPDLLRTFGLSSRDVSGDVRSLVTTFTLGANNITFKPPEWSLLGLIIIKMLSIKDTKLQILLDNEQVKKYTTMMLMSFQQDGGYLDRLMAWLTDIDNLLHKQ